MKSAILFALLAIASLAGAAVTDLSLSAGYSTLNMSDFNASDELDAQALLRSGATSASVTKLSDGIYVALDVPFEINPGYYFGPRIEWIKASQVTAKAVFLGNQYQATNDLSLFPVQFGFSADLGLSDAFSLRGGIYGGYGFAKASVKVDNAGAQSSNSASGGGVLGELNAELRWRIIPQLSLGLDLGYRMAVIAAMMDDGSGRTWVKSGSKSAVPLDFSGLNAGISLTWNIQP